MPTIEVKRTIPAPIAEVFDWLSTATNYTKSPGVLRAKLVEAGDDGAFGNGAVREVLTGIAWFREVISGHEPPHAFDYLILKSRPPLLHRSGQMRFKETAGGTEVTWTSVFEVPSPIAAATLGRMAQAGGRFGFTSILRAAEKDLRR
jgi:uncharacterized protein YndB with AHSA1/START domain